MDEVHPIGQELGGGNFDGGVLRIGDTVRRTTGPWTPAVHALLDHLQAVGFGAAPRVLGIDEVGREILTFVDGEAGHYPLDDMMRADETLIEAGHLLRQFHEATLTFQPAPDLVWRQASPDPGAIEVVCHSDWAPYNAIFRDGRIAGMIDWDFARPGRRLWDLAWTAHTWVPLRDDAEVVAQGWPVPPDRAARLRLLCDAYGLPHRAGVLPAIRARVLAMAGWIENGAAGGDPTLRRLREEGHADGYRRAVSYLDATWERLQSALR